MDDIWLIVNILGMRLPYLLVWGTAFVLAFTRRKTHPDVSRVLIIAIIIFAITSVAGALIYPVVRMIAKDWSYTEQAKLQTRLRMIPTFASIIGWGLVFAAAFGWRTGPPSFDKEALRSRPIGATAPRLLLGALIIASTTYIGGLIYLQSIIPSAIGCLIGLWLVNKFVFGTADPLDKRRWSRYWRGDLLGYWIIYAPVTIILLVVMFGSRERGGVNALTEAGFLIDFYIYIFASAVAVVVGFKNVQNNDTEDKDSILSELDAKTPHNNALNPTGNRPAN